MPQPAHPGAAAQRLGLGGGAETGATGRLVAVPVQGAGPALHTRAMFRTAIPTQDTTLTRSRWHRCLPLITACWMDSQPHDRVQVCKRNSCSRSFNQSLEGHWWPFPVILKTRGANCAEPAVLKPQQGPPLAEDFPTDCGLGEIRAFTSLGGESTAKTYMSA